MELIPFWMPLPIAIEWRGREYTKFEECVQVIHDMKALTCEVKLSSFIVNRFYCS